MVSPAQTPQPLSPRKKALFVVVAGLMIFFLGVFAAGSALMLVRSHRLYAHYKGQENHIEGKIIRFDPVLGSAPIPDTVGKQVYTRGPDIPVRFDHHGFRVPVDADESKPLLPPVMLTLGCSFSFGASCPAEKTYSYLVARQLNGASLNAAFLGYGLSQMLIQAQRLIPEYQPEVVLVQFSTWLVDRSMDPFSYSFIYKGTGPYFYSSGDTLSIQAPVFTPKISEVDAAEYRSRPQSATDYLSFLKNVGMPVFLSDNWNMAGYGWKRMTGALPRPERQSAKIVEFAYGEMERICQQNRSRMVIVILTDPGTARKPSLEEIAALRKIPNAIIVNTEPALLDALPVKSREAYDLAYEYYPASPPIYMDGHPNELAHRIIAAEILKKIQDDPGLRKRE